MVELLSSRLWRPNPGGRGKRVRHFISRPPVLQPGEPAFINKQDQSVTEHTVVGVNRSLNWRARPDGSPGIDESTTRLMISPIPSTMTVAACRRSSGAPSKSHARSASSGARSLARSVRTTCLSCRRQRTDMPPVGWIEQGNSRVGDARILNAAGAAAVQFSSGVDTHVRVRQSSSRNLDWQPGRVYFPTILEFLRDDRTPALTIRSASHSHRTGRWNPRSTYCRSCRTQTSSCTR